MPDFFFDPVQLGGQLADFGVEFAQLPFVFGFLGLFGFALIFEQPVEAFQGLFFPAMELVRMNPIFGGDLDDRFFFFQQFQNNLCFLLGRMAFPGFHAPSLHLIFARFCVQFLGST